MSVTFTLSTTNDTLSMKAIMDDDGDIRVHGAASKEEARECAMALHIEECSEYPGITLDNGFHSTWQYIEPQPADWEDTYLFCTVDADPVPPYYLCD